MTRVNVVLPEHIHRAAKIAAARQGITLRDYIVAAIQAANEKADEP